MCPTQTNKLVAMSNSQAQIAGIAALLTVGMLVDSYGWIAVFSLCAAVGFVGLVVFDVFGSSEPIFAPSDDVALRDVTAASRGDDGVLKLDDEHGDHDGQHDHVVPLLIQAEHLEGTDDHEHT